MSAHSTSARTSNHVPNPVRGCRFIDPGPTDSPPAELGTTRRETASQMRPEVLSRSVSINMQPLTGLETSVVKHATSYGVGILSG